jgi:hypothetical protein
MSLVSDDLLAGFNDLLYVGKEQVTLNGYVHDCIASSLDRGATLTVGGFEYELAASFECIVQNMLTMDTTLVTADSTLWTADGDIRRPVAGMLCTFRGTVLRILTVTFDPAATRALFRCISEEK